MAVEAGGLLWRDRLIAILTSLLLAFIFHYAFLGSQVVTKEALQSESPYIRDKTRIWERFEAQATRSSNHEQMIINLQERLNARDVETRLLQQEVVRLKEDIQRLRR